MQYICIKVFLFFQFKILAMQKVIGLGNALVDILVSIENDSLLSTLNLPKGSMQLVDRNTSDSILNGISHLPMRQISGGSASNTIHGLAQLGIETAFIGKVGNDNFGDFFEHDMHKSGINPLLKKSDTDTGRAIALISPDSERTFATFLGAAVELTPDAITPSLFEGYHILHIEGYLVQNQDLVRKAVSVAKEMNLKVSLDLASYNVVESNLPFLQEITKKYVDILFANEEEGKSFTGNEGEMALNAMSDLVEIAVYKQGKYGSLVKSGNGIVRAGALKVTSIDTTGAGDLYASGFLYGLLHDYPLEKCAKIGSITAGHVVQIIGPKIDALQWIDIKNSIAAL